MNLKKIFDPIGQKIYADIAEERAFIANNKADAVANLDRLGWNILSTDNHVFHYSYKIQKDSVIHTVSLREALNMK